MEKKRKSHRKEAAGAPDTGSTPGGEPVEGANCGSCPHGDEDLGSARALIEISVDALNGLSEEAEEWEELEFMLDSGAGTTVIGPEHAKAVQASGAPSRPKQFGSKTLPSSMLGHIRVKARAYWDLGRVILHNAIVRAY